MPRRDGAAANWTRARSIRVPDDLWDAAKAQAEHRGETVTDAVLRFLARYTR